MYIPFVPSLLSTDIHITDCEPKCGERGSEPSLGRGTKYPLSLFISNYPGKYQSIVLKEATTRFL
jgi:hypothetical protein